MKVSNVKRQIRRRQIHRPEQGGGFIVDEFHLFAASTGTVLPRPAQRPGARALTVTQSTHHSKHGKLVFIGSARYAETGEPFPPRPKKFLPAQVLRRQAR